jgi:hypothetical protein
LSNNVAATLVKQAKIQRNDVSNCQREESPHGPAIGLASPCLYATAVSPR